MYEFGCIDHALTRSSRDVYLIVSDPLTIHPKSQGPQTTSVWEIFRNPGSVRAENSGQVFDQCGKKLLSGLRCGTFENHAQGHIGFEVLKRPGWIGQWNSHGMEV